MTRILVLGYYGFGNFGDELILSAVQNEFTSIECQAVFVVNKPNQYANPVCPRHTFVDRHSPTAMRAALRACDYVMPVSYTHLRAHETRHDLVCRLLLEKKKKKKSK